MVRFFIILFSLLIFSCSPRYEVRTVYEIPKTEEGIKCVNNCQTQYNFCKEECNKNYNICLDKALKRAKEIYKQAEKDYQIKFKRYYREYSKYTEAYRNWLQRYERVKSDYEYYSRKCSVDKDWCDEKNFYGRLMNQLYSQKPKEPFKPVEPDFDKILKSQQDMCDKECGCRDEYNLCFQNCGGKIEFKKICVENCK